MIGLCCFSLQVFPSSITFGYKSCILVRFSSIISTKSEFTSLFIPSSKHGSKVSTIQERKIGEERLTKVRASLETAIEQVSGFSLLENPRDHTRDRKQRKLHLALIFECTFHLFIVVASSCFFSQLLCLI